MVIGRSLDTDHVIVHSCVASEELSPPNLSHSLGRLLGKGVVVTHKPVHPERLMVLNTLLYAEIGSKVPRASPVELPLWALSMKVARDCWLYDFPQLIIDVEERCALWTEGPFMEIAEVSIRSNICNAEIYVSRGMSTIHDKYNPFLCKELSKRLNRQSSPSYRTDMVKYNHLYLLGVTIYEVLHL